MKIMIEGKIYDPDLNTNTVVATKTVKKQIGSNPKYLKYNNITFRVFKTKNGSYFSEYTETTENMQVVDIRYFPYTLQQYKSIIYNEFGEEKYKEIFKKEPKWA